MTRTLHLQIAAALAAAAMANAALPGMVAAWQPSARPATASPAANTSREIAIELGDHYFRPNQLDVTTGDRITLHVTNVGTIPHELEIEGLGAQNATVIWAPGTIIPDDEREEIEEYLRKGTPEIWLPAGASGLLEFTPVKAGHFDIECGITGHAAAGMTGSLTVAAAPGQAAGDVTASPQTALAPATDETARLQQARELRTAVQAVEQALQASDVSAARAAYGMYNAVWQRHEDAIRDRDRQTYRQIEDTMGAVKTALVKSEPADAPGALAALHKLDRTLLDYGSGLSDASAPAATAPPQTAPAASEISVAASGIPHLLAVLNNAQEELERGDIAGARVEVEAFKERWLDVEGAVKTRAPEVYRSTENNMELALDALSASPGDPQAAAAILAQMTAELSPLAATAERYGPLDAALILLREGLEAMLVMGALLAFLKRSDNSDKARWVWSGGAAGVLASIAVAVTVNIAFSQAAAGANRELIEGVVGIMAALLLLYVGHWLHARASLAHWRQYIRQQTGTAIATGKLLSLASIAFLAVFREGAETVIFYLGIAPSITTGDLLLGLGLGTGVLAALALAIFGLGLRLPLGPFFLGASLLIYYLAFKFVGTGLHALQVAGVLPSTTAKFLPDSGLVGLFPTWETTVGQLTILALMVLLFLWNRRQASVAGQNA